MNKRTLLAFLLLASPLAAADGQWTLEQSTLTYHVSHPLHESEGVSHAARGKGVCQAGHCDFLVAASVKSFDSADSNRDLHMLQVTRGAQFAGQTVQYKQIAFERVTQGTQARISGIIPATLSDFKIDPPSLLGVAVKN